MTGILGFFGEHRYLSNFSEHGFYVGTVWYATNEHFFQASKATDKEDHDFVNSSDSPGVAKHRGKRITLREDWEEVKLAVMLWGVKAKFEQNPKLKEKLLATENAYLEETNHYGDTYWGKSAGKGQNQLGIILMGLRDTFRIEQFYG